MKALVVALMSLFLLIGCKNGYAPQSVFTHIDAVAEWSPDSALVLLKQVSLEEKNWSKAMQMRYQLSLANAQNKAFIPFTTDTLLKSVVEYYNHHGDNNQKVKAHYLLGCVYRDLHDAPLALRYYKMAVEMADTTDVACDWKTLCVIHSQMIILFQEVCASEYEMKESREAMYAGFRARDTVNALLAYEQQSLLYFMRHQHDSAIIVAKNVYKSFKSIGKSRLATHVLPVLIYVYILQQRYEEARYYMDIYDSQSGMYDSCGNLLPPAFAYYGIQGEYYQGIGNFDSAKFYFDKLLCFGKDNAMMKESAFKGLMIYYQHHREMDSVIKYSQLYAECSDSFGVLHSPEEIIRTNALLNYDHATAEMEKSRRTANRYRFLLWASAVAFVIALCLFWFYQRRSVKKKNQEANQKYVSLLNKLEASLKEMDDIRNDYDHYKQLKEQEIAEISASISAFHDDDMPEINNSEYGLIYSDEVKRLHQVAAKGKRADWANLDKLLQLCASYYPSFVSYISSPEYQLNETEKYVCALSYLQFIPSETAVLLGLGNQRVTNIRSTVNQKLFNAHGARTLNYHLSKL